MLIVGSTIFFLSIILVASFLYIRMKYREFDRIETEKEKISFLKLKLDSARTYFRKNYDRSVYDNINPKLDFCQKLISKRKLEEQVELLEHLFSMCYETGTRLKTNYDDVNYITAPLNNMIEDLVRYHMRYIKDRIEETEEI